MSSFVCPTGQRRLSHESYTVAWISPLQVEQQAAFQMLDEEHDRLPQPSSDHNVYKLGQIAGHNIVIAGQHRTGNSTTATVVAQMRMTFPNLRYGLLVGIGGGVPRMTSSGWVRLGHVVVGTPNGRQSGVVQYDYGKALSYGKFDRTGALAPPPVALLNAAQALAVHRDRASVDPVWQDTQRVPVTPRLHHFAYPGAGNDRLYQPDYIHSKPRRTCAESGCDEDQRVRRPYEDGRSDLEDSDSFIVVHTGTIASGNLVLKDAKLRDSLAERYDVLCFEMEAGGALDDFPCMVIRGISDYCDSHKNDDWQPFAATTAAAYARQLFFHMPFEHSTRPGHDIIIPPSTHGIGGQPYGQDVRRSEIRLDRRIGGSEVPAESPLRRYRGQRLELVPNPVQRIERRGERIDFDQYQHADQMMAAEPERWPVLYNEQLYAEAEHVPWYIGRGARKGFGRGGTTGEAAAIGEDFHNQWHESTPEAPYHLDQSPRGQERHRQAEDQLGQVGGWSREACGEDDEWRFEELDDPASPNFEEGKREERLRISNHPYDPLNPRLVPETFQR